MDESIDDDHGTPLAMAYDVQIIGESLLDGDLAKARFRTLRLAASAKGLGHAGVATAAARLLVVLSPAQSRPSRGIGLAYAALASSVDLILNLDPLS